MSRGAHTFRQSDLAKAIKAAVKSGVKDWCVEVADGKIAAFAGEAGSVQADTKRKPSEWD
jgi:hypothetical protein